MKIYQLVNMIAQPVENCVYLNEWEAEKRQIQLAEQGLELFISIREVVKDQEVLED